MGDRFVPDEAVALPLIPSLARASRLGALDAEQLALDQVDLVRAQNRIVDALDRATSVLRSLPH
jgi:hypothetical protein